ncbi:MAG TPA: cytidine/deoxycytidylate deaminase family protein [Candidatus Thermoplasmatota archaeon]|nr:cytidine/deoxycytidylate deaminase family protein [Candidatus Thermoplasmatota archaeon]
MADPAAPPTPAQTLAQRPGWESYFMEMARLVSRRSSCHRRAVGAVIVKSKQVLTTGYNGNPPDFEHCATMGCIREMLNVPSGQHHELCTGLHAEQNAIIQAAVTGVSIAGATLYTTTFPCVTCAKMIMAARIGEVVYDEGYPDELGRFMLARSGIAVRRFGATEPEPLAATTTRELVGVVAQMASVPNPRR